MFTREAAAATHTGLTSLATLATGFRTTSPEVAGLVVDQAHLRVDDATLTVARSGTVRLAASPGAWHYGAVTFLTADAYPANLPGTGA